jgi:DNA repair protein RecO (recombination protein O)
LNFIPARGFVLESRSFAEADKIVQLYTLSLGRVKAIVKGVRKPKSKLASAIDLFTESGFSLHKKPSADLYVLSQAKVLNGHSELKKDFKTITALQVLADLMIQSLHDTEPHPEVYSLLGETLAALKEKGDGPESILTAFVLKFLDLLGYPLELSVCVECETPLKKKKATLIPHRGGALCEDCCPSGPARLRVKPVDLEILKKLRFLPMEKVHVLKMKPLFSRNLLLTVLEYLERTIEKKLRAVEYYLKVLPVED